MGAWSGDGCPQPRVAPPSHHPFPSSLPILHPLSPRNPSPSRTSGPAGSGPAASRHGRPAPRQAAQVWTHGRGGWCPLPPRPAPSATGGPPAPISRRARGRMPLCGWGRGQGADRHGEADAWQPTLSLRGLAFLPGRSSVGIGRGITELLLADWFHIKIFLGGGGIAGSKQQAGKQGGQLGARFQYLECDRPDSPKTSCVGTPM